MFSGLLFGILREKTGSLLSPGIAHGFPDADWEAFGKIFGDILIMNLSIQSVSKQYRRDFWGLRDFSLDLEPGVLGLLGPNGAGKSTLMRILATVTELTEGAVTWNGVDIANHPDDLRQFLGYLPQDFGVYPNLNARGFLSIWRRSKAWKRNLRNNELTNCWNWST